jgi:hypothetical protein
MDPNATLREMLEIAKRRILDTASDRPGTEDDFDRLAELTITIDGWMAGGAFIPDRWNQRRAADAIPRGRDDA